MNIGRLRVDVVSGGTMRMDGGSIFGVVPRVVWSKLSEPDHLNRVPLDTNCLLIRTPEFRVLIDTGYGSGGASGGRGRYDLQDGFPIVENLRRLGVRPDDIDYVVLTHLHFDHAGGGVGPAADGRLAPTFVNAVYVVQRTEWEDATADLPDLAGAYSADDLRVIERAGRLRLADGGGEVVPGVTVALTGGHTRGHQCVYVGTGDDRLLYPADLCPTAHHVRRLWAMAYDQFPLTTRAEKHRLLREAADRGWWVVFSHDPVRRATRLRIDPAVTFAPAETLPI